MQTSTSPATTPATPPLSIHCSLLTKILHLPSTAKIPQIISTIQQLIEFKHSHRIYKQNLNQLRQQITQLNYTIQEKMFELAKVRIYQAKGQVDSRCGSGSRNEVIEMGRCSRGEQMKKGLRDCSKINNCELNDQCGSVTNVKDRVQICKQKIEIAKIIQQQGTSQKQMVKLKKEGSQNLALEEHQSSITGEYEIMQVKQGQPVKKSIQKPSKKQKKKIDAKMKNTDFFTQL